MAKVVILGPAYPLRGGLATYNERLARAFGEAGDKVVIYTFNLQYPSLLFPGKTQYSSSPPPKDLHIKVAVNSINPLNWAMVGNQIKKEKPDILIIKFWLPFMGPCFGTIARIVKKNKHTKIISILDNIIPHEKRPGDEQFTRYFLKPIDAFIAQSRSVLEELKIFNVDKPVAYSPHPLFDTFGSNIEKGIARKMLNIDPLGKYMLFFGFIRGYKGLDLILKGMGDERIKEQNIKLIIAGEYYEDQAPYRALIEENQLQDHVIEFNEFIPDEEVYKYFNACDVVVQPYKSATQSGVTQIGYHFNKPMIVTKVGGLPEIIPNGKVGFVVEPEPKQITDAIVRFYEEGLEEEFSLNASEEKKKYSWEVMVNKIKELSKKGENDH